MMYSIFRRGRICLIALGLVGLTLCENLAQQRTGTRTGSARTAGAGGSRTGGGVYPSNSEIGEAMISSDPETRSIIVISDEQTNEQIKRVIQNLDRPKPQVLIKVLFLEVTHDKSLDVGVEGNYSKGMGNSTTGNVANVFGLAAAGATPANPGGLYSVLGSDFQVTLRALAEAGKLEVLSRPSILARNNQLATISVGKRVPLPGPSTQGVTGLVTTSVLYEDVGIELNVTPFITSDGLVEMIVQPGISTLTAETVAISDTYSAPVIAQRYAQTVVVTPSGQTVVIGGLMETQKTEREKKIPLLGDIPYVGNLFKRKIKDSIKTELVIFLTPYVVADATQLAQMSERETAASQLHKGSFTEEELNKFIDKIPPTQPDPAASSADKPWLPSGRRK